MAKYDFLIIGAGFFGAVCARKLTDAGFKCLIVEKEKTVGGLAATEIKDDILIHKYGVHVLHTNDDEVWEFLSKYDNIINVNKHIKCLNGNKYYSFPFTMNLFNEVYGNIYPSQAKENIDKDVKEYGVEYRRNLEEEGIYKAGFKPYMLTIKNYYEKLYGDEAKNLSTGILREINTQLKYTDDVYEEKYTGVPENGYTKMVENIIGDDIDILLGKDFSILRDKFVNIADYVICTIPIDKFCNYIYGPLPWRTLDIELKDYSSESSNFLGIGNVRVCDTENAMLEIIEHKSIMPTNSSKNYISFVNTTGWTPDKKCMFAVNSEESEELLNKYISFVTENFTNVIFGGRQGLYRNMNICESVRLALDLCNDIITNAE